MLAQVRAIAVSLLLLASAMGLTMYVKWYPHWEPLPSMPTNAIADQSFSGDDRQVVVRAPSLLDFSQATWVLTWASVTALAAIFLLSRKLLAKPGADGRENLARAAALTIYLLTLYCLSGLVPSLLRLFRHSYVF